MNGFKLNRISYISKSSAKVQMLLAFISFAFFGLSFGQAKASARKVVGGLCVQIYYDQIPSADSKSVHAYFGKIHSIYLQNLLGHFPHLQQYLLPIEEYQAGDIERCKASIYLGTYFENSVPSAFLTDYVQTRKNVLWAGYNIWKLPSEDLDRLWKVRYQALTKPDYENKDRKGMPGFYKYYSYKGETFIKFGGWNSKNPKEFLGAFEITDFAFNKDEVDPYTLSWAKHSATGAEIPYILRNENHFYIGDSPFSYITEEDRYLIFSDLIFDILDEQPRFRGKKPALYRIEDIHPNQPLWQLYNLTAMLQEQTVPYTIALIPVFSDPFGTLSEREHTFVPLISYQPFLDFLDLARDEHQASFVYHGVTHQLASCRNPYNAMSGDDFEFWDIVNNRPVPQDSSDWVTKRLQDGHELLSAANVKVEAWESPHYQASPLDYTLFGQLFTWNVGRITYYPHVRSFWSRLQDSHAINVSGARDNAQRLEAYSQLQIDYPTHLLPSGQFFPYEIYGDLYDQRLIPENVGNFEPYYGPQAPAPRTVDDLIRVVKRNSVLRDVWASFFMHAHLLEATWQEGLGRYPGDTMEMQRFIKEVRAAGYEFISLKDFTKENTRIKRNPTLETFGAQGYR